MQRPEVLQIIAGAIAITPDTIAAQTSSKDLSDRNADRWAADTAHRRHRKDARRGLGQAWVWRYRLQSAIRAYLLASS